MPQKDAFSSCAWLVQSYSKQTGCSGLSIHSEKTAKRKKPAPSKVRSHLFTEKHPIKKSLTLRTAV